MSLIGREKEFAVGTYQDKIVHELRHAVFPATELVLYIRHEESHKEIGEQLRCKVAYRLSSNGCEQ